MSEFFSGHVVERVAWQGGGPIDEPNPHFHVLRVAPLDGVLWVYVSVGSWAWQSRPGYGLEFIVATAEATMRAVEVLAWTSWYDRAGVLGLGHTVPLGEPWFPGSALDHDLISLPYPWGPDLEVCHVDGFHVDFLWLLPITASERDFKAVHGLEALEQRFEDAAIEFWDPHRPSVV